VPPFANKKQKTNRHSMIYAFAMDWGFNIIVVTGTDQVGIFSAFAEHHTEDSLGSF